jgi:hypothetical protein
MDLWDVLKLMVRRWYASVPLLVASLASAVVVGMNSEPDYVATSYVALLQPRNLPPTGREDANANRSINPWTVDTLMGVVVTGLNTKSQHDRLAAEGLSPTWVASTDYNFRNQLVLEVTADSPAKASATSKRLRDIAITDVANQQKADNVREGEEVTTRTLDGENLVTESKKIYRLMIVIAAAGFILTTGLVIALDALLRWRSSRRAAKGTISAPPTDKQGAARVGKSPASPLVVSSVPSNADTSPATGGPPTQPDPKGGNSSVYGANGSGGETILLPGRRNGDIPAPLAMEYRVITVESESPSGPPPAAETDESRSEATDATVMLPLSNAARAARDRQQKRRDGKR